MNIEEQILEERLQNWGRWNRDPKRQGRSPLCAFMEGAKDDDEEGDKNTVEPHSDLPPVDVKDALLVQKAWQKIPSSLARYRKAKMVVGVAYCYSGGFLDMRYKLLKYYQINVHEKEFDKLLAWGRKMMKNNLLRLYRSLHGV